MILSARTSALCLGFFICICGCTGAEAPPGISDPAFGRVPFAKWIAGPDSGTRLRWSAHVGPAQLSYHQRLVAVVTVQVDGAELARRRGKGELVAFAQYTDASGVSYQSHTSVDLSKVAEGVSASNVSYLITAFVLPGEYRVAILLMDSASKEHWSKTEKVQFAPLRHDPLPDSWRRLPPVEFIPVAEPPESWLLSGLEDRVEIPAKAASKERIDILVNLTPSERQSGSTRIRNETLGALIPTLKVIAGMRSDEASLNIALLDLSRRRVVFHQENVRDIDWESLKNVFAEDTTGTIDLKSLQDRGRNAAFFVKEVNRRISANLPPDVKHAVIVLSGSIAFEPGEDLRPVEATPGSNYPIFYIRYRSPAVRPEQQLGRERDWREFGGHRGLGEPERHVRAEPEAPDQLEKTLKPISPRLFDVETPEQMRKAIADIRASIATF